MCLCKCNFYETMREYSKALEIYSLFNWGNQFKAIGYDEETEEILVSEEQLMRIIQMVNPLQKPRKIRLVSTEELFRGK
jgi:hypothetical protein